MSLAETTDEIQSADPPRPKGLPAHKNPAVWFKPGQSGNPLGRPRGSRNKLTEDFVRELSDDFSKHGVEAIQAVRMLDPSTYLKVIAGLMPKELKITDQSMGDMSDGELIEILASLRDVVGGGAVIEGSAVEEAVIVDEVADVAGDGVAQSAASEGDASRREGADDARGDRSGE